MRWSKKATYLGVAYLQSTCVQLFDPGVVRGHQDTVLPPQDGGGGVSCHRAVEDHRAVHSHRLIDRALADNGRRAVRHDCERRKVRIIHYLEQDKSTPLCSWAVARGNKSVRDSQRLPEMNEIQLGELKTIFLSFSSRSRLSRSSVIKMKHPQIPPQPTATPPPTTTTVNTREKKHFYESSQSRTVMMAKLSLARL